MAEICDWLRQNYVQHADARQQRKGLSYMTAETSDLAREIHQLIVRQASQHMGRTREAAR